MSAILIWGAGNTAQIFLNRIDCEHNTVIAFVDNDVKRQGSYATFAPCIPIVSPIMAGSIEYDILIVCSVQYDDIMKQCEDMKFKRVFGYQDFDLFKSYPLIENKVLSTQCKKQELWNKCILLTIKQIIQPVIDSFENYYRTILSDNHVKEVRNRIWSCWWQGEENAPVLVRKCFESIRSRILNYEISMVIITKDNWNKYIEIPEYIFEKVKRGLISYTHLSDIIRIKLLKKYGGLWLDATIYCPHKFDVNIFQRVFYSIKRENIYDNFEVVIPKSYTLFLINADKHNILLEFLDRAGMYYWQNKDSLLVFHLFVYMVRLAYDSFSDVQKMIDNVPINNLEVETLNRKMNEAFDKEEWERMSKDTSFFKLSNRQEYREYDKYGQMTFYGFFIRGLL